MSNDYECPHCGKTSLYTSDPIGEDEETEVECKHCGKPLMVYVSIIVNYYARCMDGDHEFEPISDQVLKDVAANQYARIYKTCVKCGTIIAVNDDS